MSQKTRIDILALPECTSAVLYSLYEILRSVGSVWSLITGEEASCDGFDVRIVSPIEETFRCSGGVPVIPDATLQESGAADVIIVPDLLLQPGFNEQEYWHKSVDWVTSNADAGAKVCSVCTGSILLASAGLLDGKEATSHWSATGFFEELFPDVRLKQEHIFIAANDDHSLITTGGSSSWNELVLYLIKHYFGYEEAARAAKIYLLGDRRDGQLPFAIMRPAKVHKDAIIDDCQIWIADHYNVRQPVSQMIERSGLTDRTFTRRFAQATGYKPVEYVQTLRVEEAKQLLETTDVSVEEVSEAVGYEDPSFFRRLFKRVAGVSPAKYRQKFQLLRNLGS